MEPNTEVKNHLALLHVWQLLDPKLKYELEEGRHKHEGLQKFYQDVREARQALQQWLASEYQFQTEII